MDAVAKHLESLEKLQRAENELLGVISTFLGRIADARPEVQQVIVAAPAGVDAGVAGAPLVATAAVQPAAPVAATRRVALAAAVVPAGGVAAASTRTTLIADDAIPSAPPKPGSKLSKRKAAAMSSSLVIAPSGAPAAKVPRTTRVVDAATAAAAATTPAGTLTQGAGESVAEYLVRVMQLACKRIEDTSNIPAVVAAVSKARPGLDATVTALVALVSEETHSGAPCMDALRKTTAAIARASGGAARLVRACTRRIHALLSRGEFDAAHAAALHDLTATVGLCGGASVGSGTYAETCCFDLVKGVARLGGDMAAERATVDRLAHFERSLGVYAAGIAGVIEAGGDDVLPLARLWALSATAVYRDVRQTLEDWRAVCGDSTTHWSTTWLARAAAALPDVGGTVCDIANLKKVATGRVLVPAVAKKDAAGSMLNMDAVMVLVLLTARLGEEVVTDVLKDQRWAGVWGRATPQQATTAVGCLLLALAQRGEAGAGEGEGAAHHHAVIKRVLSDHAGSAAWSPAGRAAAAAAIGISVPASTASEVEFFTGITDELKAFIKALEGDNVRPVWVSALAASAQA